MFRFGAVSVQKPPEKPHVWLKTALLLVALAALGVIVWAAAGGLRQYFDDKEVRDAQKAIEERAQEALSPNVDQAIGGLSAEQSLVPLESRLLGSFLFVRASAVIGGEAQAPRWFMIDSGSSYSALGQEYANALGVQPSGYTQQQAGASTRVGTATGVGFALHSSEPNTPPLPVAAQQQVLILNDSSVLDAIPGAAQQIGLANYGGILGVPFLEEYSLAIDYQAGSIEATKRELASLLGGSAQAVPLQVITNAQSGGNAKALVQVYVGSASGGPYATQPPLWLLDLGSDESVISIQATEQLNRSYRFTPIRFTGATRTVAMVGGEVQIGSAHVVLAVGATVGAHQRSRRPVTIAVPHSTIQGIEGYGGDLGGDYLKQLGRIGVALKERKLYVV